MEFAILGPVEVRRDGRVVALGGSKPRAVLAVLLLHMDEPVSGERLAAALWGDDAPPGAVRTVHVHVSRLRKALGDPGLLATTAAGYRLRLEPEQLDQRRFDRLLQDGRRALAVGDAARAASVLREALSLWRGPALAGLEAVPFAAAEIGRLEEQRLAAVEARVEADLTLGHHRELIGELQRLVAQHPLRERLHAYLMLALYRAERQADALEAYRLARHVLVEELGLEPGTPLRRLEAAILAHDSTLDAPQILSDAALGAPTALSVPPTALFGRDGDAERLAEMVQATPARLVTVIGPGGVGKTRLAVAVARHLAGRFADGACLVTLAPISHPGEIASTIVRAVAAPVRDDESPASALLRHLQRRHLLLLLDNFEHVLAGAPLVADLLASCPELTVLATSREPTRLAAERLYPLDPLEVPAAGSSDSVAALEQYGAIALFCDRARARDPAYALDAANMSAVAEICRRLDGLPLAVELAAARVGLLSPTELNRRLDRALQLLVVGARDAPERQRTLRATIDWSVGLLTEEERRAFGSMGVFAAGATIPAAEAVTGASLDTLDSLVAKQLLVAHGDRLLMLETVREYARDQLAGEPSAERSHERLADWCQAFARMTVPRLRTAERVAWLSQLDAELPNLLQALAWALKRHRQSLALRLAADLGTYWWQTSRWQEGLPWLQAAAEQANGAPPALRAAVLLARARLTHRRRLDAFREDLEAALALFRAAGDSSGTAYCLAHLSYAPAWAGDHDAARALIDEALHEAERSGDELAMATTLLEAVNAAPGYDDARALAPRAIAALEEAGDLVGLVFACSTIGWHAIVAGAEREGIPWLEKGRAVASRIDDPHTLWHVSGNLGLAQLLAGDTDAAAETLRHTLSITERAGNLDMAGEALLGMAGVAARRGQLELAARLTGAATTDSTPHAVSERIVWSRLLEHVIAPAQARYGTEAWRRAEEQGASLTPTRAINLALHRSPSRAGEA